MRLWYIIDPMNPIFRVLLAAVLAVMLMIGGCKETYYDLELLPEGDTLYRSLIVEADEDALTVLEEIYGHPPVLIASESASGTPRSTYKFEGAFQSLSPCSLTQGWKRPSTVR